LKEEPTWKKKNNNEDKTQQKFFAIPEENGINSKTSITLKSIKTISSSSLSEIPDTGIGKLEVGNHFLYDKKRTSAMRCH
jgi:hypothetical protein